MTDLTGYDARGRPTGTTLTVPSGVPGLSGSYAVSQTYDRAAHVTSTTYPAVGGRPAETVTTRYKPLGLPESMSSPSAEYVITSGGGRGSRVGYSLDGGVSFNGGGGNPPDYVSLPSLREAATAVLGCVVNSSKYVPAGAYGRGRIGTAVGHPVAGTAAGASLGLLVGCAEGMIDPNPPGMP